MTIGSGIAYAAFWMSLAAVAIAFLILVHLEIIDERSREKSAESSAAGDAALRQSRNHL